ncbi:MAG: enoyl-CoA hydratase/isomerase family protein [Alphaproteobacteria bacterium]|nr:enoyl-CoA hydratase/isomerase family protein [Alphaproteobacteria bacterium]
MTINKIAVIGSGVMGSGIAAQIANAGVPVVLLDIKLPDKDLAKSAVEKMLKTDPAPFMHSQNAKRITTGNLDDDLDLLKDVDWIIEVVLEDLKVKHETYEKLNAVRKKGSVISSNTSTIPLQNLIEPFGKDFAGDFLITHFFNPPRYMRLLELVTGKDTRPEIIKEVANFCDVKLGKGVVTCHDTPGFIANRLGVFWMQMGVNAAVQKNVPIEIADAVMSKPVGIPKTGIFALIDLVGVDLMPKLAASMLSTLPEKDQYRTIYKDFPFIHDMIAAGYTGRKGKGGFYRLDDKRKKQALKISAETFSENEYKLADKVSGLASVDSGKQGLRAVVTANDIGGQYAYDVLLPTLAYAASLVPEIAGTIADVDEAMRLGYNWKRGPFEMIDELGAEWFAGELSKLNIPTPDLVKQVGTGSFYKVENGQQFFFGTDGKYHALTRADGVLLLKDIKLKSKPVYKTSSAALWDIGDDVLCLEFTAKMNALDDQVFAAIDWAIKNTGEGKTYKALVVYNEGSVFSAGANLGLALFAANIALWPQIEELVSGGQRAYKSLKFAPFPVVSAPSGLALGGGCEILLHSDHVQAHAETYCGLVEVGVGFIPGWGGCKEMILRAQAAEREAYDKATGGDKLWFSPKNTPMGATRKAFEVIGTAQVAKSAAEAKSIGYFRECDGVTMNRDRLLFDAKKKALELAENYEAPKPVEDIRLGGASGKMALDLAVADLRKSGKASPYDVVVCDSLAKVLSGGDKGDWTVLLKEDDLLKLEREEFMKLARNPETLARIEHMLDKGKPLRN